MSDSDALMWTIEKDPMLRSTITAVSLLDRARDRDRFRDLVDRAHPRSSPACASGSVGNPLSIAPPRWEVDPNFDLDYHLRFVRAGGDGSVRSVLDLAQPIAMQGFDRARPLWEMYRRRRAWPTTGPRSILKLHHAITDGVGVDPDRARRCSTSSATPGEPDRHAGRPRRRTVLGPVGPARRTPIDHERRRKLGIAPALGRAPSPGGLRGARSATRPGGAPAPPTPSAPSAALLAPATAPLAPLMTGRSLCVHFDTLVAPPRRPKAAAKRADGTLNDAFVAAAAGGFRRYHDALGAPVDALRMTMPINVRTEATAGPRRQPVRARPVPGPDDIDDPVERMPAIHDARGRAAGRAGAGPRRAAGRAAQPAAHLGDDRHLRRRC